jgi:hypothetical protein
MVVYDERIEYIHNIVPWIWENINDDEDFILSTMRPITYPMMMAIRSDLRSLQENKNGLFDYFMFFMDYWVRFHHPFSKNDENFYRLVLHNLMTIPHECKLDAMTEEERQVNFKNIIIPQQQKYNKYRRAMSNPSWWQKLFCCCFMLAWKSMVDTPENEARVEYLVQLAHTPAEWDKFKLKLDEDKDEKEEKYVCTDTECRRNK